MATAHDAWTYFDYLPLEGVTDLGASKEISLETLIAAQPDFIVASCNTQLDLELLPTFEEMGIPAAYFEVSTFESYLSMLERCTQITGQTQNYKTNGTDVQAQVDQAIARADGSQPTVLYIRVSSSGCKAVVLVLHDLPLALAGAHRLAVLQEGVLVRSGTPEEIYQSGVLEEVFSVRQGRTKTTQGWRYYCKLPPKEEE